MLAVLVWILELLPDLVGLPQLLLPHLLHHHLLLVQRPRAHAAQLLHVAARPHEQAEVHAEGADVGARLALHAVRLTRGSLEEAEAAV